MDKINTIAIPPVSCYLCYMTLVTDRGHCTTPFGGSCQETEHTEGLGGCRFTIDVRLEGYTKATESHRILLVKDFYRRRSNRHVYHTTSGALFAT